MSLTIKDIAKMAGVSPGTVSKIINNYSGISQKTKKKVMTIIEETGYQPSFSAKALATKKSDLIGLIYAGKVNVDINHPFFNEVINSFKREIGLLGYDILLFSNEQFKRENESYLSRCRHFQLDGCLIIAGEEIESSITDLDNSDVPCIGIDMQLTGPRSSYVMTDNYKISSIVIEHLYLNSIREIAFIGGSPDSVIAGLRTDGFLKTVKQFGLSIKEDWIKFGDFTEDSGYQAMKDILAQKPFPQAVFASSDMMAFGAIRACKETGFVVPDDIKIIGCDDIEACRFSEPTLTTVKQDKEKLGKMAAFMLNDLISGASELDPVLVDPELALRKSCGT